MKLPNRAIVYILSVGCVAWLAPAQNAVAQSGSDNVMQPAPMSRADWEQRAVQSPRYDNQGVPFTRGWSENGAGPRTTNNRTDDGWNSVRRVSATAAVDPNGIGDGVPVPGAPQPPVVNRVPAPATPALLRPEAVVDPSAAQPNTMVRDPQGAPARTAPGYVSGGMSMEGATCGDQGACCGAPGGETYCEDGSCCGWLDSCHCGMWRNVTLFAGVQGFKGPLDQGSNGNFGFHEGLNFGGPVSNLLGGQLFREIGYQIGANVVESDLSGQTTTGQFSGSNRDQIFATGGLFHRAMCGGLQWGVVYDYEHDPYYTTQDYYQFRAEAGLVSPGCHEIGVTAAFGNNQQYALTAPIAGVLTPVGTAQPLQLYQAFFRKYFAEGGEGQISAGVSNMGDGLIGAGFHLPVGGSLALENTFQYVLPNNAGAAAGQQREGWSLSFQLVWTPGRSARCQQNEAYNPLMPVADNGSFIIDRH